MKRSIMILLALVMIALCALPVSAGVTNNARVIDKADLLTPDEEADLTSKLLSYSEEQNCDLVFLTEPDMDHEDYSFNGTVEDFADMYYETHGYDKDGVLVLILLDNGSGSRRIQFSCSGKCMKRLTEEEQDKLIDDVYFDLKASSYYSALNTVSYEMNDMITPQLKWYMLPLAVGVSFLIAMLIMSSLKRKLKSVEMQRGAANYVRPDSMIVTASRDTYLYSTVSKTARESSSSGGGGSRTSSGGGSHSGTGRNF